MKCDKCQNEFEEKELQESHDVPCYLFEGKKRKDRKNQADKYGRHWLCDECHKRYEWWLFSDLTKLIPKNIKSKMIERAQEFSIRFFKEEEQDANST